MKKKKAKSAAKLPVPPRPAAASTTGKYVVLGIFGLGIALALFAWWWNLTQNRDAAQLWGQQKIRLLRQAPQVVLWKLADASPDDEEVVHRLSVAGHSYWMTNQRNIAAARGLIHARYALTDDASFDWAAMKKQPTASGAQWNFAVRFGEAKSQATMVFDLTSNRICCLETGKQAILLPRIMDGWQRLLERETGKK